MVSGVTKEPNVSDATYKTEKTNNNNHDYYYNQESQKGIGYDNRGTQTFRSY